MKQHAKNALVIHEVVILPNCWSCSVHVLSLPHSSLTLLKN